jgi:UDP-N-acetylglucosamine 2-epimerase
MFRQYLLKEGIDSSRIIVTGQPRLDKKAFHKRRNNKNAADKIILYCNQPVKCSIEAQDRLFLDLVDAADSLDNVRLFVKLHPRDLPESHWIDLLNSGQGRSLIKVTKKGSLIECFDNADAFMTIASTTCLEAMEYGLPVGLINYLPIEWYLPYQQHGAVISVQSRNDLSNTMKSLLFDESLRLNLMSNSKQVLRDELYLRDSMSAARIANYIHKTLAERLVMNKAKAVSSHL